MVYLYIEDERELRFATLTEALRYCRDLGLCVVAQGHDYVITKQRHMKAETR